MLYRIFLDVVNSKDTVTRSYVFVARNQLDRNEPQDPTIITPGYVQFLDSSPTLHRVLTPILAIAYLFGRRCLWQAMRRFFDGSTPAQFLENEPKTGQA